MVVGSGHISKYKEKPDEVYKKMKTKRDRCKGGKFLVSDSIARIPGAASCLHSQSLTYSFFDYLS